MRAWLRLWADNFTPLRSRDTRIYLGGQAVGMVGSFLQSTALGLLVYRLSGGAAVSLGVLSVCTALPLVLLSPFAGGWADRFDRRRVLVACQCAQMGVALSLALLTHTGAVALWHIYALGVVLGCAQAVYFPAQQAFFFDLAGLGEIRKLISINSMVLNVARTCGPALAGFCVARWGAEVAFWQNALSFLAVIAALQAVRREPPAAMPAQDARAGLGDALRLIAGDLRLRNLYVCAAILQMLGLATLQLVPALTGGDARATGWILAGAGAGSLCYAFLLSPFLNRTARMAPLLSLALAWMGLWFVVMAQSPRLELRVLAIFMAGLATSLAMVGCTGTMQYVAPPAMRGRFMGLFNVVGMGSQPFAVLLTSAAADRIGAAAAITCTGTAAAVLALAMLAQPAWARWELDAVAA